MRSALYDGMVIAQSWDGHMDWDNGWWILMMLGMLIFWGLVVVAFVWAVRSFAPGSRPSSGEQTPIELLERRLAEGSISVEEYEQRREVLLGSAAHGPQASGSS